MAAHGSGAVARSRRDRADAVNLSSEFEKYSRGNEPR